MLRITRPRALSPGSRENSFLLKSVRVGNIESKGVSADNHVFNLMRV